MCQYSLCCPAPEVVPKCPLERLLPFFLARASIIRPMYAPLSYQLSIHSKYHTQQCYTRVLFCCWINAARDMQAASMCREIFMLFSSSNPPTPFIQPTHGSVLFTPPRTGHNYVPTFYVKNTDSVGDGGEEDSDFEESEVSPAPAKRPKGKGATKATTAAAARAKTTSTSKPKPNGAKGFPAAAAGNKKKRQRSSTSPGGSRSGSKSAQKSAGGGSGGAGGGGGGGTGGGGGGSGGVSAKPAWMRQRWVQVGKTDAEANVPVAPSPVTDPEFDEMVRSCVRNDAMEKVKAKRAALAKRLQVRV